MPATRKSLYIHQRGFQARGFQASVAKARDFAETTERLEVRLVFDSIVFDATTVSEIVSLIRDHPRLASSVAFTNCSGDALPVVDFLFKNSVSELAIVSQFGDEHDDTRQLLLAVLGGAKTSCCIETLKVRIQYLGSCGGEAIGSMLAVSQSLKNLSFDGTFIKPAAVPFLGAGLGSNFWIESVTFADSLIADNDLARLTPSIQDHPTMLKFEPDPAFCGPESIGALAKVLGSEKCQLRKLDLRYTNPRHGNHNPEGVTHAGFGQEDLRILIQGLSGNRSLEHLTLAYRALSDETMIGLADMLCQNSTLRFLDLSHCQISDRGLVCFAGRLPRMGGLKKLWLGGRQWFCRSSVGKLVLEGLRDNTEIVDLILPAQDLSYYYKRFAYYTSLNAAGRRVLRLQMPLSLPLWPLLLERANRFVRFTSQDRSRVYTAKEDLLYYLIRNGLAVGGL